MQWGLVQRVRGSKPPAIHRHELLPAASQKPICLVRGRGPPPCAPCWFPAALGTQASHVLRTENPQGGPWLAAGTQPSNDSHQHTLEGQGAVPRVTQPSKMYTTRFIHRQLIHTSSHTGAGAVSFEWPRDAGALQLNPGC